MAAVHGPVAPASLGSVGAVEHIARQVDGVHGHGQESVRSRLNGHIRPHGITPGHVGAQKLKLKTRGVLSDFPGGSGLNIGIGDSFRLFRLRGPAALNGISGLGVRLGLTVRLSSGNISGVVGICVRILGLRIADQHARAIIIIGERRCGLSCQEHGCQGQKRNVPNGLSHSVTLLSMISVPP